MASLRLLSKVQEEEVKPLMSTSITSNTATTDAEATKEEEEGPRRVSFRNDEVLGPSKPRPCQAAKSMLELASLVQLSQEAQDFSDSEDEDEEGEDETEAEEAEHDDAVMEEEQKVQTIPAEQPQVDKVPEATEEEEEDTDRGLELKTSKERQQRKFLVLKCVVKCQHQCRTPEQLANIARICNRWATDAARIQAVNDYQHVYACQATTAKAATSATAASMELPLPDMNTYPLPVKRKQPSSTSSTTSSNSSSCRNVRRRTNQD